MGRLHRLRRNRSLIAAGARSASAGLLIGLLFAGGTIIILALWVAQKSHHPFDLRDVLMDPGTGKASLNALILSIMAALAIWVVIDRESDGRDDVTTLLLGVLGIFVTGRVGAQLVNKFGHGNGASDHPDAPPGKPKGK